MSSLTHSEKRNKARRSTPAMKRRRARTSKLRVMRIKRGDRRSKGEWK